MKTPEVPPPGADKSRQTTTSDAISCGEAATILAGLERQRTELGPIAEELIDLLQRLGVGKPPPGTLNPSRE